MATMVSPERVSHNGRRRKLTDAQLDRLVQRYNNGETQVALSKEYGVSVATVRKYLKSRTPQ